MDNEAKNYDQITQHAQQYLRSIPKHELGPAGRKLVEFSTNGLVSASSQQLRGIKGGQSKSSEHHQPPLLGST